MSPLNTRGATRLFRRVKNAPTVADADRPAQFAVRAPMIADFKAAKVLAVIWLTIAALMIGCMIMSGCEAVNPMAPTTNTNPGQPQDNTPYWTVAAPRCSPRAAPDLSNPDLRFVSDTTRGLEREIVYWDVVNEWRVYGQFLRVEGRWLLCFWDTMG